MLTDFGMCIALLQSQLEAKDKEITKARKVDELNVQHSGIFLQDYTQFFWHKLIRTSPSILLQWQKFAASTEEYENQIARQTTAVTRSEFAKASAEEKLVMMIGEQVKMHLLSLWSRLRAFTIFRWLLSQKERIRTLKCLSYNLSLQGKAQEKIKSAEDRVRQIEQKMEADKICYSEAIAKELAKVHHHHHHSTHSKLLACISPQVLELVLW